MIADAGSVVVAGTLATIARSVILARGGRGADLAMRLAARSTADPQAAFAAGIVLRLAFGIAWAFVYGIAWSATGWPIAPLQGALFGGTQWLASVAVFGPRRGASFRALGGYLAYGAFLGAVYVPGA